MMPLSLIPPIQLVLHFFSSSPYYSFVDIQLIILDDELKKNKRSNFLYLHISFVYG